MKKPYIQTFHCHAYRKDNPIIGRLYPNEKGYTLVLEGAGLLCAPKSRFHAQWGRHTNEITQVEIGEGITEICSGTFKSLHNLSTAQFP